ncbi:MAG: hypothetical protein PHD32_06475 [Eubacteriales bacterium]|nr:hypothetical protein [Eubacteriales bacterium]
MKNKSMILWGVILVAVGVLLVLTQVGVLHITGDMLPAVIMLGVGVCFHIGFALSGGKNPGLLVPGGILLVYGGLYLACAIGGFGMMAKLWPLYILGVALGLFELYAFSRGRSGSMIPVFILTTVGGAFLLGNYTQLSGVIVVGIALVILGVVLFVNAFERAKRRENQPEAQPAEAAAAPETPAQPGQAAAAQPVNARAEQQAEEFHDAPEVTVQPEEPAAAQEQNEENGVQG